MIEEMSISFSSKDNILDFVKRNRYLVVISVLTLFVLTIETHAWIYNYWKYYLSNDLSDICYYFTHHPRMFNVLMEQLVFKKSTSYSFILFLPLYKIFNSYNFFHFLHLASYTLVSPLLYLLAREKIRDRKVAFFIASSFLTFPYVLSYKFIHFSVITLSFPFIVATFYFYEKKKFLPFFILMTLSVFFKENIAPIFLAFGIFSFFRDKDKKWFISMVLLSVLALSLYFHAYQTSIVNMSEKPISENYDFQLSNITLDLVYNKFTRESVFHVFGSFFDKFLYLPLLAPQILFIFMPKILEIGLLQNVSLFTIETTIVIPFFFIGVVYALSNLKKLFSGFGLKDHGKKVVFVLSVMFLISSVYMSMGFVENNYRPKKTSHPSMNLCNFQFNHSYQSKIDTLKEYLDVIRQNGSFSTDNSVKVMFSCEENFVQSSGSMLPSPVEHVVIHNELYEKYFEGNYGNEKCNSFVRDLNESTYHSFLDDYRVIREESGILLLERKESLEN